ncbi:MAG: hypothetical protein FGM26_01080 [Beijerinckiaceae bacterium]|nr:hypothetical protein [Beijerinckiaceae bacterium]
MNQSLTYLLSTGVFVGGLAVVAFFLMRYRDRLQMKFGMQGAVRQIVQIAPQARLALVEIDGMKVLCGLGRDGITALEIVSRTPEQPS